MGESTRHHIIDSNGEACFGSARAKMVTNKTIQILIGVIEITSSIYRPNERNGTSQYRIAGEGEKVSYIFCGDSEYCWFKTKSRRSTRNNIVWRRKKEEVLEHGKEYKKKTIDVNVQKLGEFGPKGSSSACFLVPFGILHRTRREAGIWISTEFYNEKMLHHIASFEIENIRRNEVPPEQRHQQQELIRETVRIQGAAPQHPSPSLRPLQQFYTRGTPIPQTTTVYFF